MTDPLRARYWWHLVKQKNRTRQALREPTASLPSEQDGNVLHCTILSPFYYYNDFINRVLNDWCWEQQPHNLSQGFYVVGASLRAQLVKNPPAMQEAQVRFLGWEDPLEKG